MVNRYACDNTPQYVLNSVVYGVGTPRVRAQLKQNPNKLYIYKGLTNGLTRTVYIYIKKKTTISSSYRNICSYYSYSRVEANACKNQLYSSVTDPPQSSLT